MATRRVRLAGVLAGGVIAATGILAIGQARAVDHPDLFTVTSPDLADNGMLKSANAGTGKSPRGPWECGGRDVSPALAWSHAPAATKTFAVVMDDPDAASGRGGSHWVMYGIPAAATSLARGAGANAANQFVGGANGRKLAIYSGPCAEPGAKAHHFVFMVFALDIAPGVLAKGLGRDALMQQIQGHNLAEASLVARYRRPLPRPQQ